MVYCKVKLLYLKHKVGPTSKNDFLLVRGWLKIVTAWRQGILFLWNIGSSFSLR